MQIALDFECSSDLCIAGVDEAGRGPLAGPVVAAAVILDPKQPIKGLHDSKQLTKAKRRLLYEEICSKARAFAIKEASQEEIDTLNILQASLLAMRRAVEALSIRPEKILVDGLFCPPVAIAAEAIIKGDALVPAISAASILAKVYRDQLMQDFDREYPGYGFGQHAGYPTKAHLQALQTLGASPIHRQSFGPVKNLKRKP